MCKYIWIYINIIHAFKICLYTGRQSLVSCEIRQLPYYFKHLRHLPKGIGRNGGSQLPEDAALYKYTEESAVPSRTRDEAQPAPLQSFHQGPLDLTGLCSPKSTTPEPVSEILLGCSSGRTSRQTSDYSHSF